jgi:hypothetical protein
MPSLYEKGGVARRRQSCIAYPDGPEHSQNFPSGVTRDMDNIYDRSEPKALHADEMVRGRSDFIA